MKLTQIRNATNRLEYADKTFLIDPWLMPKHQFSFVDVPGHTYRHMPISEEHRIIRGEGAKQPSPPQPPKGMK